MTTTNDDPGATRGFDWYAVDPEPYNSPTVPVKFDSGPLVGMVVAFPSVSIEEPPETRNDEPATIVFGYIVLENPNRYDESDEFLVPLLGPYLEEIIAYQASMPSAKPSGVTD